MRIEPFCSLQGAQPFRIAVFQCVIADLAESDRGAFDRHDRKSVVDVYGDLLAVYKFSGVRVVDR